MSDGSVNKAIMVGRAGDEKPELRRTPSGRAVTSFILVTISEYKDKGGERRAAKQWHKLEAWDDLAELCSKNVRPGLKIYAEGRIVYNMDEKNGVRRQWAKIKLSEIQIL
jgi:single-strand DNA-binding protein